MTEPIPDKLSERIDTGVRVAIAEAIERHRLLGESISIFQPRKFRQNLPKKRKCKKLVDCIKFHYS